MFERIGRGVTGDVDRRSRVWRPPTDVYETPAAIVVRVEIAGMREQDFHVELVRRRLIISGRREDDTGGTRLAYQQMEIAYGDFRTDVYVPWPVAESAVEATYRDGFLVVTLPKASVHRVPVVSAGAELSDKD
jgi:HSP20 family protein